MTTVDAPLLRAIGLHARQGRNDVLHGIDLEISSGEVVAILGPNGAGKTTLLQTFSGLLKPRRGQLERRGRVASALQSPDLARRSSRANVEIALAWWGVPRRERRARAEQALEAMNASHLTRRPARSMSGGERRRVHLARAVAVRPDVLLLDEPFAGLDAATRGQLLDETASVFRESAQAVVLVVHDRAEAWALADRLVVLLDGRIAADGTPGDILEQPPTVEVARFLGFTGTIGDANGVLVTRPSHVTVDADGDLEATVARVIPIEDGARLELDVEGGRVSTVVAHPVPRVGEKVWVRVTGGCRFATADA